MPTNGETVYKTHGELQSDIWLETVARIQAEVDAKYDNEVDRNAAMKKRIDAAIEKLEFEKTKIQKMSSSGRKGDLATKRGEYLALTDRLGKVNQNIANAQIQNTRLTQNAREMNYKYLDADPGTNAISAKEITKLLADPAILSLSKDEPDAAVNAITERMVASGLMGKILSGSDTARREQVGAAVTTMIQGKADPAIVEAVFERQGYGPALYDPQNIAGDKETQKAENLSGGANTAEMRKMRDDLALKAKEQSDDVLAAEAAVQAARDYIGSPEYVRIASLTEEARMADPGYAKYAEHMFTVTSNADLFGGKFSSEAINKPATERLRALQAERAALVDPTRATRVEVLQEANAQATPSKGGAKDLFAANLNKKMDLLAGLKDDERTIILEGLMAGGNAAKMGGKPDEKSTAAKLYGADPKMTPAQLLAVARQGANGDEKKLNEIIAGYYQLKSVNKSIVTNAAKLVREPGLEVEAAPIVPKKVKPYKAPEESAADRESRLMTEEYESGEQYDSTADVTKDQTIAAEREPKNTREKMLARMKERRANRSLDKLNTGSAYPTL